MDKPSLFNRYIEIRKTTLNIVKSLEIEDFSAQPVIDVSPPKWHLGHTTWFFENFVLAKNDVTYQLYDEKFNFIFNSYYVSQGDRLARNKRGSLARPSTQKVLDYRTYVDNRMEQLLAEGNLGADIENFIEIGLNHEQQHQELLITDIKYIFSQNPLKPSFQSKVEVESKPIKADWLSVDEGIYEIGHGTNEFCFDNELGKHKVYLEAYQFLNRLITNQEYLDFINDKAYERPELWLSEGWDWIVSNHVIAPEYWFRDGNVWKHFTVSGIENLKEFDTVTHVSFYEAEAFARWKGMRLLTEQEWEVAANIHGSISEQNHFQEEQCFHLSSAKDNQLIGSAWEWTNSAYLPYPNYKQAEGALGEYNGKFMINQMILRGGSCATPKSHYRNSYRNFFHPNLRWQFTGIRLAKR